MIGDVGEGAREEVDFAPSPSPGVVGGAEANYGWSCREGSLPGFGTGSVPVCEGTGAADFDPPVFEYDHVAPDPEHGVICSGSIIGGYVARDPSLGALDGRYVYADYCTGAIRSLLLPATAGGVASDDCSLGLPFNRPTSFGEDAAGRLYIASSKGGVYRFSGPLEHCLPDEDGADTAIPDPLGPISLEPTPPPPRVRLRIAARRLRGATPRVLISISASPCAGQAARRLQLRRGGRPNGGRRLGRGCRARFRRYIPHRSTFRARLLPQGEVPTVTSRRLVLGPQ